MDEIKIGPDGEPIPIGTPAQRLIGAAVAATFNSEIAEKLKQEKEKLVEQAKHAVVPPVKVVHPLPVSGEEAKKKQEETNKIVKDIADIDHKKDLGVPKIQIKGEGTVIESPAEEK